MWALAWPGFCPICCTNLHNNEAKRVLFRSLCLPSFDLSRELVLPAFRLIMLLFVLISSLSTYTERVILPRQLFPCLVTIVLLFVPKPLSTFTPLLFQYNVLQHVHMPLPAKKSRIVLGYFCSDFVSSFLLVAFGGGMLTYFRSRRVVWYRLQIFTSHYYFLLSMYLLLRNVSFPSFHSNQNCRLSSRSKLCYKKAVVVYILVKLRLSEL